MKFSPNHWGLKLATLCDDGHVRIYEVCGLGVGVWGLGFGVWGLGFGVWGLGFGVWGFGFDLPLLGFLPQSCCRQLT